MLYNASRSSSMPPSGTSLALGAASEAIKSPINDLYSFISGKTRRRIEKTKIKKSIPSLYKNIEEVVMVKTIWHRFNKINVEDFYCDSHVIIQSDKSKTKATQRKKIISTRSFGEKGKVLIQGIGGQGKSIFLRHLCYTEYAKGKSIPVFIELNRLQKDKSLKDEIVKFLSVNQIKITDNTFEEIGASFSFAFFLDAFDEVPSDEKQRVQSEIEHLVSIFITSKFYITSRFDESIESSAKFYSVKLDYLKNDEYKILINKLAVILERDIAENIIKDIENNSGELKGLIKTPLLVSLVFICYQHTSSLPNQLSKFYEDLFEALYSKHDSQSKSNYKREYSANMGDVLAQKIFERFCFETKMYKHNRFTKRELHEAIEKSLEFNDVSKEQAQNYFNDIVKITCLVLKDGTLYSFIHKSVQEFYTALYIKNLPDITSSKFYMQMRDDDRKLSFFNQEMRFLINIDHFNFSKEFLIPLLLKYLYMLGFIKIENTRVFKITIDDIPNELFLKIILDVGISIKHSKIISLRHSFIFGSLSFVFPDHFRDYPMLDIINDSVPIKKMISVLSKPELDKLEKTGRLPMTTIYQYKNVLYAFKKYYTKIINDAIDLIEQERQYINRIELEQFNLDL